MNSKKRTVIVTGGCGYIGSHTVLELLRQTDYEVVSIDNFSNSFEDTQKRVEELSGKTFVNYNIDLAATEWLEQLIPVYKDKVVGIIHFAALKSVPESVEKPLLYYRNNMDSLINILSFSEAVGAGAFIFSSSCSVYGNVAALPVTEVTPLSKSESPYAHTKKIGEELIQQVVTTLDLKAIALRYFNPVGADHSGRLGERPRDGKVNNLVPVITQTAAGLRDSMSVFGGDYATRDGSCIRDYIHVTDIANAHLLALNYIAAGHMRGKYDVYNLGTGNGVSVLEAIAAFEKCSGKKLRYEIKERRSGDVEAIYSNSEKVYTHLKWEPKYGINEMMSTAWVWQGTMLNEI